MFLNRNQKNNVYPCKPQFYYIKVGFKGVKIIQACFRDGISGLFFTVDPDQMSQSAASDLHLYCLSVSILWDTRHKSGFIN